MSKEPKLDKHGLAKEESEEIERIVENATKGRSLEDLMKYVKVYPENVAPDPSRVCPKCGNYRYVNSDKFCGKCGHALSR